MSFSTATLVLGDAVLFAWVTNVDLKYTNLRGTHT